MDERFVGLTPLQTMRRAVELFVGGDMSAVDFQTVYLHSRNAWIDSKVYASIDVEGIDEQILYAIGDFNEYDELRRPDELDHDQLRGIVTTLLTRWRKLEGQTTQLRVDFAPLDVVSRAKRAIQLFVQGELSSSQFLEYFPTYERLPSDSSDEGQIIHEARRVISYRSEWDEIGLRADMLPLADRLRAMDDA